MGKRGGYREGAGRPKGSKNKENKALAEILESEKTDLLEKAIKLAKKGNIPIMTKLLDKIVPTLNYNETTTQVETIDSLLNKMYEERVKYVNKADKVQATKPPEDNKPVSVDDKTS